MKYAAESNATPENTQLRLNMFPISDDDWKEQLARNWGIES
jgi:hypothetical protein